MCGCGIFSEVPPVRTSHLACSTKGGREAGGGCTRSDKRGLKSVCVGGCVCVSVSGCVSVCMGVFVSVCAGVLVCVHVSLYAWVCTCEPVCVYVCVCVCLCVCVWLDADWLSVS